MSTPNYEAFYEYADHAAYGDYSAIDPFNVNVSVTGAGVNAAVTPLNPLAPPIVDSGLSSAAVIGIVLVGGWLAWHVVTQ